MDDFNKDIPAEGVVIPFPTLDRVKFYRNHLQRSMAMTLELYGEYVSIQDRLVAEVIECENCMLELTEELKKDIEIQLKKNFENKFTFNG